MIISDNPEAMTHFVRRDRIAGLWPGGRASPIAGGADWPSVAPLPGRSVAPLRGHVSSFNKKTRNASEISLAFRVFLSRLWESNPRPIHYE